MKSVLVQMILVSQSCLSAQSPARASAGRPPRGVQRIDLSERLAAGKLRGVNRTVTKLQGSADAVYVDEQPGPGVVWLDGIDFAEGTIEIDVRGRDLLQRSFVGVAFHRKDDATYESVYVRPFNFRPDDPARRKRAVQYMAVPDYDWPRLRQEFPGEFESGVDALVDPTGWIALRVAVQGQTIQAYIGAAKTPALSVRKLGKSDGGAIGLWTGNNSDGSFANPRITPQK